MKIALTVIFLFSVVAVGLADLSAAVDRPGDPLNDEEMAQVVTAMFEATYAQPDPFPVGGFVYVSERSLRDQWVVNPIAGFTMRILTPEEIGKHSEEDFTCLEFGRFSRITDRVKASVNTYWTDRDGRWRSGEATDRGKKVNGKWEIAGKEASIGYSCGPPG